MLDFVAIRTTTKSQGRKGAEELTITIYPEFLVGPSEDLMVRGGGFYAVWDEKNNFWTRDIGFVIRAVDEALMARKSDFSDNANVEVRTMRNFSSNVWNDFLKYTKSLPDNYHELDSRVIFADDVVKKNDYVSKKLSFGVQSGRKA